MKVALKNIIDAPEFTEGTAWVRRHFQANETIVKEGEAGKSLFFIEEGILRVSVHVELDEHRGIQPGIGDLKQGSIFGETCLYQSRPRTASVVAISDGCLLEIDGEKLSVYLDAHPIHGYFFYKRLYEVIFDRLNSANHTIESLLAWGLKAHGLDTHL
ncbi:MAG: cyclic nucleotide-binding domain-containing protein [Methylococcaceae bacterium]